MLLGKLWYNLCKKAYSKFSHKKRWIDMGISNKNNLYSYFEEKMNKSYKEYDKNSKSAYENTLLKTYIIESNFQGDLGNYHDNVVCGINEIIGNNKSTFKLTESKDEDLLVLSGNELNLYMELYNKRFWFIHTMNKSTHSDNFIKFLMK